MQNDETIHNYFMKFGKNHHIRIDKEGLAEYIYYMIKK